MQARTIALTLALLVGGVARAQSADRLEGPIPEEVEAYKQAAERFAERGREFREDTQAFVAYREAEERQRLTSGYDALLESLGELERNQRELTIQRFEEFLAKHPDAPYSSHVRFRLADLYFELENERWLERSRAYFAQLNDPNLSLEAAEALETQGEPRLELSRSVALYKRIIADNKDLPKEQRYERLDGTYLMLGFVYFEENAALPESDYPPTQPGKPPFDPTSFEAVQARKTELAKATFRELIARMPESDLADRAHLFLGNFVFDEGSFDEAVAEYRFVYQKGKDGPYFDESIYQLAWANYKQDRYAEAIPLFAEVLDQSEVLKRETGKESNYRPDAAKYMAFSFADLGGARSDALNQGTSYFSRVGAREYEWDVYVEMADALVRYSRWAEAVEVYRYLQDDPRWVNRPENPEFQMKIVQLYGNVQLLNDLEASGDARLELTRRYNEGTPWWEANRNNPDALAVARGFIESSLGQVANELRVRAQESEDPADYLVAAEKYQEYLDKFPISDDYYEVQWLLADSLRLANQYSRAATEYDALIRSSRFHPYLDGALVFRLQLRNQELAASAPPGALPPDAEPERTYTTEAGKEITVYKLGPTQLAFIEAADAVLGHEFGEPAPNVPDFREFVSENRHALTYIPGQILFWHNRYDEARPRLESVISRYPRKDEASYSASLLVDSYVAEGDLEQVRRQTMRFTSMILGSSDIADPTGRFRNSLEEVTYKQAEILAEGEDQEAAAEAFLAFLKEFPDSEYKEYALYSAARSYHIAGKAERANELYEEFINKYPTNEQSEQLYFRVASLYESTLQLDKAVNYYKQVSQRFPNGANAPDAVYNAAYLQIGLGQPKPAAEALEAYGTKYPDREDAEKVFFQAGEQWEAVGQTQALQFYDRYLAKYGSTNPENQITAMARKADIYKSQGNDRSYQKELDRIDQAFDATVASGKELGPNAHKYAAMAAYRGLKDAFDAYTAGKLTGNDEKDATFIFETKKSEMKAFEERAKAFATKYENFQYSSEALLLLGLAPLHWGDLGLSVKCPKGMREDDCFIFYDSLEEKFFPQFRAVIDQVGIPRLLDLVNKAKELKKHSPAIDKALAELNERNPSDYPAIKREIQGETDSTAPAPVAPVKAKKPKEEGQP